MTLEEIYRRMKQNNQYYEGSQAQKEEQAGMTVQGDNVNHTQESANINKKYSNNRIGYIDTGSRTKNAFIQIGRDAKKAGSNLMIGAKRGANQLWNYIASQEINQQKKMAESMRKAFENNNIPIEEDNPIWKSATDEKLQEKYIGNIENKISKYDKQIQKNIEETGTKVSEKITELAPSIGNMIPGTIASMANPALGAGYFTTSAGGSYLTDARNKGATEEDALKYATALGVAEGATEMVGVGNLLKGGKELGKGAIKEALKSYGVNIADNFIQEAMMEPIQEATSELILGESDWNNIGQRMVSSGIDGALTALIMDGASSGISSSVNLVNKVRNKETITQNDINIAKQDLNAVTNKITELENKTKINNINNTKEIWKKPSTLTNDKILSSTSKTKGSDISPTNSIISKNQIKSTQGQIAPLNEQTQIKYDSKSFAKQIDEVKNGVFPKNNTLVLLKNTPKVLKDIGLNDLPITMTQKHLETISQDKGRYKNANYHNLGIDVVKQLPEAIANPLNIYKSSTKDDSIVLVTHLSDKKGNIVLASIKVDGKGTINGIIVDANHMTSAYGKDNYDYNIDKKTGEYKPGWAELNKDNMIYDIDEGIIKKNISSMARFQLPRYTTNDSINNIIPQNENYASNNKKVLNPIEISNLKENDIATTPKLPNITYKTDKGNKSKFYNNLMNKTGMLNDDVRNLIKNENDIKYYEGVTNVQSLREANERLQKNGSKETFRWFSKDLSDENTTVSATEVAEGWILLKQYQDAGDYESAVKVAKRMRDMATKSGQALQAYSIQARLTPEGMFQYAQSELKDAFERFSKNKTQDWINKHKQDFDLKPEETQAIINKVKEAQNLPSDSYEKKEKLAEIQKIMTDKLPPERGAGIKSWMRISMLFNPKTQVRNILGNAIVSPVNAVGDVVSSIADKALAKKTGVRTVGLSNPVQNIKGFKKGLYESYNDFKKGINTREISGDRFEIGQGKAFKGKGLGKALNRVDQLLNFMLDAGDRPFYEATFNNSINNQLILNNTDIVTQDMIDIATNEALSRTWQDNNNYTKFVLSIRNAFNGKFDIGKIHTKGFRYGLGDVLIPFAKTPANLTKAIVDYSPIGLVNSLVEGNNIRKAIGRSDLTAQQQHKFVQDLGKATAGTMLYVIGYSLAKAGITSGESDEDKDVANFMKNNLGTTQYSIKIGNKTFTYDWAQPIAAPIAMMANLANKDSQEENLLEEITSVLDIPMNMILEQSFMQSIQEVLSNNGGVIEGVIQQVLDLPSRAVPTFLKQITDMTDTTQRASYEKGKPIQTAVNQAKAKIPGLSKQLAPVSNTLGNDIKKYGGETNPFLYAFHTFLNPANVNSNQKNRAGSEIYKVYEKTGDKTIFPRQAEYTQIIDGTKITLTSNERYQYQKTSGKYYSNVVNELLKSASYKNLSNENKAEILKEIATDSNEKAKEELAKNKNLEYERQKTDVKIEELVNNGLEYSNAYIYKTQIKDIEGDKDNKGKTISSSSTAKKAKYIMDMDTNNTQKDKLLSLLSDTDTKVTVSDLKKLNGNYLTYMQQSGKKDDKGISARDKYMMYIDAGIPVTTLNKYYDEIGDIEGVKGSNGKTVSGSKKKALFNYINSLSLNTTQKKILFTKCNSSYGKNYKSEIHAYINSLNISKTRKEQIWSELYD